MEYLLFWAVSDVVEERWSMQRGDWLEGVGGVDCIVCDCGILSEVDVKESTMHGASMHVR